MRTSIKNTLAGIRHGGQSAGEAIGYDGRRPLRLRAEPGEARDEGSKLMGKGILVAALAFAVAFGSLSFAAADDAAPSDPASADQGASGCDSFAWRIARERAWFGDAKLARRASGARLSRIDRAVELALLPTKKVRFFMAPEQAPDPGGYSGEVTFFGVPKPATYQVTLSDEAWIEVFENGARLKFTSSTGAKGCAGVRKSVRFKLAPGNLVLIQLSGATKDSIKVAFTDAE
jgi:hypothetical protein